MTQDNPNQPVCTIGRQPDYRDMKIMNLHPEPSPADYREALDVSKTAANAALGENMLLSSYDRDRDFESPQHASECNRPDALPGYVEYGLSHGARLKVDIGDGRFVFFFLPLVE